MRFNRILATNVALADGSKGGESIMSAYARRRYCDSFSDGGSTPPISTNIKEAMAGEYVYSLESLTKQHAGKTILDDINLSFFFWGSYWRNWF